VVKTGRINWRCSRRRVNNIKCPSGCYTQNGQISRISPHSANCLSTHGPDLSQTACTNQGNMSGYYKNDNNVTNGYEDNYEDYNEQSYYENGNLTNTYNEHFLDQNSISNPVKDEEEIDDTLDNQNFKEYDLNDCSPETFASLIKDMNEMKHREGWYREKLAKTREIIEREKNDSSRRMQQLKWKARMSEIEIGSLKATLNYTNRENAELRKLVGEMLNKFSV